MQPVAKGRPKFTRNGYAYTPTKTREAEAFIKTCAIGNETFADGIPLLMTLRFYFTKPKSAKKRVYHTVKPDCTNLAKLVEDSLNGITYHDDSAIVQMFIYKDYGEPARIEVEINQIGGE